MVFSTDVPEKKNKSAFSSWFGADLNNEVAEPSHVPFLWDDDQDLDDKSKRESLNRRRSFSGEGRPKSAIAVAQANKPRVRTTPLKRTTSMDSKRSEASGPGHLIRISSNNQTTVMVPPRTRETQKHNEMPLDVQSAQSSITNSWAPRSRLYHPAPYMPHKPIENMVITVQKPGSECEVKDESGKGGDDTTNSTAISSAHSAFPGGLRRHVDFLHGVQEADEQDTQKAASVCMQSLALTEQQKAEVEQYVFRGWGSDDDGDGVARPSQEETRKSKQNNWFFQRKTGSNSSKNSLDEEGLPHSTSDSIENAIKELQALTGIQVRCLDDDGAVKNHTVVSQNPLTDNENATSASIWFFGAPGRKPNNLLNDEDELAQPYALIRNEHDEARVKKHFQEEERLRKEEEKRLDEEKKRKKTPWFFFAKEEDHVVNDVIDDDKIADALDDLEILAGEVRVSQVKEARLLEKGADIHSHCNEDDDVTDPLDRVHRSRRTALPVTQTRRVGHDSSSHAMHNVLRSPAEENMSPDMALRLKSLSDKQKKSLSRFELPLDIDDNENPPFCSERSGIPARALLPFANNSARQHFSNSFSSVGKLDNIKEEHESNQCPIQDFEITDTPVQDRPIDETISSPPKASDLKREALIADPAKRDLRWRLNQALVNSLFKPYHSAMADIDSLLPSQDEFDIVEHIGESVEAQFQEVRNTMLADGNLSEREVASFFGGFSLLAVKARSLQSQLDAFKAISRAQKEEQKMQNLSSDALLNEDILKEAPRMLLIKSMHADPNCAPETKSLLKQLEVNERKRIKLEKEIFQHGSPLPEHIPFEEATGAVERISQRIHELRSKDPRRLARKKQEEQEGELAQLEMELEMYKPCLILSCAWVKVEEKWEADNASENHAALRRIRRNMPVNVKFMSEDQMAIEKTPNGKLLPRRIAKKFKQTTILQLLRTHPDEIHTMHPSVLENLQTVGLTLSERRAIYLHLKSVGLKWRATADDPATSRKWMWYRMLKQEFKEALSVYQNHCQEFGPPESHPYTTRANPSMGCPLIGKQCPVKADKMFDYGVDYGFPDGEVFACSDDPAGQKHIDARDSLAPSENGILEKALRRNEPLKRHYKGRVLQIALANDSCEAMDEIMDRMGYLQEVWIEDRLRREKTRFTDIQRRIEISSFTAAVHDLKLALPPLAERSGMQLTGTKDFNSAQPDGRSPIELGLCEEVWEHAEDFFTGIEFRLKELDAKDAELKSEIIQLRELIDELHNRNMATINELGVRYPEPSRKLIKRKEIERRVRDKLAKEPTQEISITDTQLFHQNMRPATTTGTTARDQDASTSDVVCNDEARRRSFPSKLVGHPMPTQSKESLSSMSAVPIAVTNEIVFLPSENIPDDTIAKASLCPRNENRALIDSDGGSHDKEQTGTKGSGVVLDGLTGVVSSSHQSPDLHDECDKKSSMDASSRSAVATQDESAREVSSSTALEIVDLVESSQKLCSTGATGDVEVSVAKAESGNVEASVAVSSRSDVAVDTRTVSQRSETSETKTHMSEARHWRNRRNLDADLTSKPKPTIDRDSQMNESTRLVTRGKVFEDQETTNRSGRALIGEQCTRDQEQRESRKSALMEVSESPSPTNVAPIAMSRGTFAGDDERPGLPTTEVLCVAATQHKVQMSSTQARIEALRAKGSHARGSASSLKFVRDRKSDAEASQKTIDQAPETRSDMSLENTKIQEDGGTVAYERRASTRAETNPDSFTPEISDQPAPVNSIVGLELEKPTTNISDVSIDKTSDSVGRQEGDATQPNDATADSIRRKSFTFRERIATGKSPCLVTPGILDESTTVSLELEKLSTCVSPISDSKASDSAGQCHESDMDKPDNTTTADSFRRKSLLLRERIAAGKSPGRDRIAVGTARERIALGKSPGRDRYNSGQFGDSAERSTVGLELAKLSTNVSSISDDKASDSAGQCHERDADEPGNTTTADSIRRKSLLLRERIAAGKSPGRDRISVGKSPARERLVAGKSPGRERISVGKSPARERLVAGKSPGRDRNNSGTFGDSAERLAVMEARREQIRANIAERKKAREEAARSSELKLPE